MSFNSRSAALLEAVFVINPVQIVLPSVSKVNSGGFTTGAAPVTGTIRIMNVQAYNKGGAYFLMFFDDVAVPPNGTPPSDAPIVLPAGGNVILSYEVGNPFFSGFVWAASSTAANLTIAVADDVWLSAEFI